MDAGLIFTFGAAFGLLGTALFASLLLLSDPDALAYFSARLDRLGVLRARRRQAQGSAHAAIEPHLSGQSRSAEEQPGGGGYAAPAGHSAPLVVFSADDVARVYETRCDQPTCSACLAREAARLVREGRARA